jgi:hypothetical protein
MSVHLKSEMLNTPTGGGSNTPESTPPLEISRDFTAENPLECVDAIILGPTVSPAYAIQ